MTGQLYTNSTATSKLQTCDFLLFHKILSIIATSRVQPKPGKSHSATTRTFQHYMYSLSTIPQPSQHQQHCRPLQPRFIPPPQPFFVHVSTAYDIINGTAYFPTYIPRRLNLTHPLNPTTYHPPPTSAPTAELLESDAALHTPHGDNSHVCQVPAWFCHRLLMV